MLTSLIPSILLLWTAFAHASVEPRHALAVRDVIVNLPAACNSTCASTVTILNECVAGNTTGCVAICQSNQFNQLITCAECSIENTPNFPPAQLQNAQMNLNQLVSSCASQGYTVPSVTLTTGTPSATGASATSGTASSTAKSSAILTADMPFRAIGMMVAGVVGVVGGALVIC